MSEVTGTSRSKTFTGSSDVSSVNDQVPDRWTHNITYRELIISTCISVFQLWWHPYIHDLKYLVPFLFLYNVFSVFVGYPMFYLELALGVVTGKSVLNCWDLSPSARGLGIAMLTTAAFTALVTSCVAAWSLGMFVHSFHTFLPWLHCAANADTVCAARHRPMQPGSETPAQSFFFNFILHLKRDGMETGLGTIVKELSIYYMLCWILIYCIAFKRIYSISKLVLFKDVLAYFVLLCCGLGAVRLNGAGRMFRDADWSILFTEVQIYREAAEFALIEMTVSQGTLVMLGSYCPRKKHALNRTALLSFLVSKTSCMISALTLGAAHGALMTDYDAPSNIKNGSSASMILWADYVARVPGSQFWSALMFFTLFVLGLTTTALILQTLMSCFTGRSVRKMSWAFLILISVLFMLIGVIFVCTQGGLYIVNFVMRWPSLKPRVLIAALMSIIVTYQYGQKTFCEDVYFSVGEYPSVFLRVCWAVAPSILIAVFLSGTWARAGPEQGGGWLLVSMTLFPILLIFCVYAVFRFRVRNIVGTEK